ncbi:RagB/SusD family nutrient uptake outer membrane protein [Parapedobacter tibetensis]|uniref:RagB/SusD family nutrient uptake outer membrane protein n=1 Tax=Parapedobacter tibetensis TaxID=2972951 RepID=UPI00214D6DD7|nr:RagB/SusD family nutrient uptake outer membrane protein [Parapedobacter tibetensis]
MKILNNQRRNIGLALSAMVLISVNAGCEKFLDTERQGEYTADNYPYPEGGGPYDEFLFSAYNTLRNYHYVSDAFMVMASIRSDDADKGSTPADGGADVISMDNFPVLPSSGRANGLWVAYYTMINNCNIVLDHIANNTNIIATPEIKVQSEAEARFLRAYSYFVLVRAFGRVPKIDKILAVDETNVPQSSPEEIYAFIESDLQFAAANLPPNWPSEFVGRITSGAANGILAKVYLTQQKWGMAMSTAQMVMGSGEYDLSTPYSRIFGESGENSRESVFEIQATASAAVPQDNGVQYASIQGVRGTGEWNRGWGWNMPSAQLEAAYEPNDPRRERTILYTSTADVPGYTIYGDLTPTGLPNPKYNQKVLAHPSFIAAINNRGGRWMNVRILRYADVVLMYAEAANEVGGEANAALAALNSVRARARAGDDSILPDVTTTDQAELRLAIQQERRIELAMEHERFFDIVRWGISQQAMDAAGKVNFTASRDNLLPIPQVQIDLSNGVLTQNPGYN